MSLPAVVLQLRSTTLEATTAAISHGKIEELHRKIEELPVHYDCRTRRRAGEAAHDAATVKEEDRSCQEEEGTERYRIREVGRTKCGEE